MIGRPLNPVLARELKERMRTRRATIVVVVWLFLLGATVDIVYQARAGQTVTQFGGPLATQSAAVGRTVFETLVFLMLVLVVLMVPGLTADAVTGERERQTLVPLQVTLLRPRSIVAGKLLASIAFVALLVVLSLPLMGVSFILGGVTASQLAGGAAAVLGTAVLVACLSIFCSTIAGRTQSAMVLALFLVLLLAVGGPIVYGAQRVFDDSGDHPPSTALLVSPFFAAADIVGGSGDQSSSDSPLEPMRDVIRDSQGRDQTINGPNGVQVVVNGGGVVFAQNGQPLQRGADRPGGLPFWARSALFLAVVSLFSFMAAAWRVRTPSNRTAS